MNRGAVWMFLVMVFVGWCGVAPAQDRFTLDIRDVPRVATPVAQPSTSTQETTGAATETTETEVAAAPVVEEPAYVAPDPTAGRVVSNEPYPVAEVKVLRQDVTSSSFFLHLDNMSLVGGDQAKPRAQTWLVAGARGRTPSVYVQSAEFVLLKDGKVTTTTTAVPGQMRQGFTRLNDLGQMRQYWLYTLTVTLSSPTNGSDVWVCKSATILLDIGAPTGTLSPEQVERFALKTEDPNADPLPKALLLNPDILPDYYTVDYNDPLDAWQRWNERLLASSATGDMFRLNIYRGGFYRISAEELNQKTTGSQVSAPATAWRVFRNGTEVPVLGDPHRPEEAVYLPVAQGNRENLRREVYWVDTSGRGVAEAAPPQRFEFPEQTGEIAYGEELQTSATYKVLHRELKDYNPRLRADQINDRWIWAELKAGTPERLELNMPPHFDATGTVKAVVKYGFSNFPPVQPKLVMVTTSHESAESTLTSQMGVAELELPASALRPGKNEVAVQLHYPPEGLQKRPVSIQSVETVWTQDIVVPQESSYFFETSPVSTAPLHLAQPLDENTRLFVMRSSGPQPLLESGDTVPVATASEDMLLANVRAADVIRDVEMVTDPLDLQGMTSARSIIITALSPDGAVDKLRAMQEGRGVDVRVYRTVDIYDNFAYGDHDPASISRALRYLFFKAEGLPPEYVTLVGEASNFRGDPALGPANVQRDMLPSSTATKPDAIQGDEKYTSSIGDDMVGDFVVGRIPAGVDDVLLDYLTKMETYNAEPAGEWSRRTQFVMDDNVEFPDVVASITEKSLSPAAENRLIRQWDFEYVNYLRVPGMKRSWQATDAVVDSFNEGLSILNYFGHGGPNLWSHERLFHLNDLPRVQNGGRLPLITCASCDNAWITYPMPPVNESMGELLVMKPDGGGIGLFGPVSGASPYEHSTLVQSLMEGLLRAQLRRAGEATFYAKSMYYAVTRSTSIPEQYLLLGDPTVQLKIPVVEPLLEFVDDIQSNPGKVVRGRVRTVPGFTVLNKGTLTVRDAHTHRVISQQPVSRRQSAWQVVLPSDYAGGSLMAMLEWDEDGETRFAGGIGRVLPPLPDPMEGAATRKSIEGNGFDIRALGSAANTGSGLSFEVAPTLESTSSGTVSITALADGKPLGAPTVVDVTSSGTYRRFSLPAPAENLDDREIQIIASRVPHAVTVATFDPPAKKVADLEFVPGSAKVSSLGDGLVAGSTVLLEAELRNVGTAGTAAVVLTARKDDPTTGTELVTINQSSSYRMEGLEPGESRKVQYRWEQPTAGTHNNIYLAINQTQAVPESNFKNNSIVMPSFDVKQLGDFQISEFDVSPPFVTMGSTVTVSAVFTNPSLPADRPVTVELGWQRAFDGATTSTRQQVRFEDGYSTFSEQISAPEGFTQLFLTVNSDKEIEEINPTNNTQRTGSMIAYELQDFQREVSLGNSLEWGLSYNVGLPFEAQLQVVGDMTSNTLYVLPKLDDVTSGNAVASDVGGDNAWSVLPWRVAVKADENAGVISMDVPIPGMNRDVPGRLVGHFTPFQSGVPVRVNTKSNPNWFKPVDRGMQTNLRLLSFGAVPMEDGKVAFSLDKTGNEGVALVHLSFWPRAMQWDSVPYQLPASLQNKPLRFAMDTDPDAWEKAYVEWRSGRWDNNRVTWDEWVSNEDVWNVTATAGEFVQFRVIGVPKQDQQPFISNVRIMK